MWDGDEVSTSVNVFIIMVSQERKSHIKFKKEKENEWIHTGWPTGSSTFLERLYKMFHNSGNRTILKINIIQVSLLLHLMLYTFKTEHEDYGPPKAYICR